MNQGRQPELLATLVLIIAVNAYTSTFGQEISSQWLNAADGNWVDASNWSTSPSFPDNDSPNLGDTYDVLLDAAGSPYTVSLADDISISRLAIDSADATLAHDSGQLNVGVIDIVNGLLVLGTDGSFSSSGEAEIVGATISGNGQFQLSPDRAATPVLNGVTLGLDTTVPSSGSGTPQPNLLLRNGLNLASGATISIFDRNARLDVEGSQIIGGMGEILFENPGISNDSGTIRLAENTSLTIGPDVSVRTVTMGGSIGTFRGTGIGAANIGLINDGLLSGEWERLALHLMNVDTSNGATFENRGTVEAIGDGRVVVGGDWTNTGVFRIRDNGTLFLGGEFSVNDLGTIDRIGGQIFVSGQVENVGKTFTASASTGDLNFGRLNEYIAVETRIIGGTIASSDGAKWTFQGGNLENVTLAADATFSRINISGNLTLDSGTMSQDSSSLSDNASISFVDSTPQVLNGNGMIQFSEGQVNRISVANHLTVAPGVTIETAGGTAEIRGDTLENEGRLIVNDGGRFGVRTNQFLNQGVVETTGILTIGNGSNSSWTNEGTIRIKPGGSATLDGTFTTDDLGTFVDEGADRVWLTGVLDNTGRTLDLEDLNLTVPLTFNGGEIRGGTITSSGSATLDLVNSGVFTGVTLATDLTIPDFGGKLFIQDGLTLDNITLTMPEGAGMSFVGDGPQTLNGTGTIFAPNRPATSAITTIAGDQLTIGENITIRNGFSPFRELEIDFKENRGTIIAEAPDTTVTIGDNINLSTGPLWVNHGVIRVLDGTLQFQGNYSVDDIGVLDFVGGEVILQGNILNQGRTIQQNSSTGVWKLRGTVHGGRIETSDGVVADVAGTFDNVTLAGEAVLSGTPNTTNGALRIPNTLTLDGGTLTMEPFAELAINEPVTLSGDGQILLNGTTQSTRIQTFTGGEVTIGTNVSVRTGPTGGGTISRGSLPVFNQGTISAETAGQTLVVDGTLQNTGTLQSLNGSTLRIDVDNWVNDGTMHLTDGMILINSDSFENGASGLISGSGEIELAVSSLFNLGTIAPGETIGALTIDGALNLEPTSLLEIEIGGKLGGEFDTLSVSLDSVLDGQLSVSLVDGFQLALNQSFSILSSAGSSTGEFIGLAEGSTVGDFGGVDLFITYAAGDGNDVALFTAVPEPASGLLLLIGSIGIFACRAKRREALNLCRKP